MFPILSVLCSGLATGLLLSVPIGPANLLCLEKTLKSGTFAGFITGAGATFGDFLFVLASVMGIIVIGDVQFEHLGFIKYVSVLVLLLFAFISLYKGYAQYSHKDSGNMLLSVCDTYTATKPKQSLMALSGFFSSFILTITNPLTPLGVISSVTAVGLGSGMLNHDTSVAVSFFIGGILIGSLGWWFCLTLIARKFAQKLTQKWLGVVNFMASVVMIGMGIYIFCL
jgi:threonine/homoserine/homoserine lactone efflux protein